MSMGNEQFNYKESTTMGLRISEGRKVGSGLDYNNPRKVQQYLKQQGSTSSQQVGSNTLNIQIRVDVRSIARIAHAMTKQGYRPQSLASIVSTSINTTLDTLPAWEVNSDTEPNFNSFEESVEYLTSLGLSLQQFKRGRQVQRISMAYQSERYEEDRREDFVPTDLLGSGASKGWTTNTQAKSAREELHSKEELLELDYRDRANALYSSFIERIEYLPELFLFRQDALPLVVEATKNKQSWAEFLGLVIYLNEHYLGAEKKTHIELLDYIQGLSLPTTLCPHLVHSGGRESS